MNGQQIKYCGLFGGSFDPPHVGHLKVSQLCLYAAALDTVWWVTAPQAPNKSQSMFSWHNRMAMIEYLLADKPQMRASDAQYCAKSNYSIDMVEYVQRTYPNLRFCFIVGADNFLNLHYWKHWQELCALLPFLVVSRPYFNDKIENSVAALTIPGTIYYNAFNNDKAGKCRDRKNNKIFNKLFHGTLPLWVFLHGLHDKRSSSNLKLMCNNLLSSVK